MPDETSSPAISPRPLSAEARRSVYLIDPAYQLREVSRAVTQFVILIFVQVGLFFLIAYLETTGTLASKQAPLAYISVAFVIPILLCILYSLATIRHSHRVAGAAFRLAQDMRQVATDPTFRFRVRKDDYLQALVNELNQVMKTLASRQEAIQDMTCTVTSLQKTVEDISHLIASDKSDALREHLTALSRALAACSCTPKPDPSGPAAPRA